MNDIIDRAKDEHNQRMDNMIDKAFDELVTKLATVFSELEEGKS